MPKILISAFEKPREFATKHLRLASDNYCKRNIIQIEKSTD